MKTLKVLAAIGLIVLVSAVIVWNNKDRIIQKAFSPTETNIQADKTGPQEEVVATGLDTPWEIAFLPDKTILVTQRNGELIHFTQTKGSIKIAGVFETGEGGLLGMAIHPKFSENKLIYFYYTTTQDGGSTNRVESYTFENEQLSNRKEIITKIPAAANHDGGRIAFGPDGYLYITTGDAQKEQNAQITTSLSGKILRLKDDGGIPTDNPFGNAVYSYGHRNPQGLAWDSSGNLWSTEHGPSGLSTGFDELNKIEKGKNYGWPKIKGDEKNPEMVSPTINSGSKETWAPAGLAFYNGALYFAGLRGQTLYKSIIADGNPGALTGLLQKKYGRLRAVVAGPDGYLYVSTSNKDGRGQPQESDDKIIRLKF